MASNTKEGCNYLDGVPIKISAKFLPPRPVPLPYTFDLDPGADILDVMYDFTLEKKVLENHGSLHQLKLRKKKANPETECNSSDKKETVSSNGSLNPREPSQSIHSNAQNMLRWQSDAILQPKPQQLQNKVLSEGIPQDSHSKINLSDFENDTSSPFDYMELQTINDLEELSSVFEGIHNNASNEQLAPAASETHGNVSKSKSFPLPLNSRDEESALASRDFGRGSLSTSSDAFPQRVSALSVVEDVPSDSYQKLSQVPYISSYAGARVTTEARVPSLLRGSKSYSDISSLGKEDTTLHERSRTPPSTFFYCRDSEDTLCKNVLSSNGACDSDLPDPYHELESSAKEFVDSITEMGFSRPQVARTVKHLGTDEKKVVEHLCQIQALEESGYEGLEAEAALHLHDYNRDEAKVFLDLVSQFQDLGFEKSAVKKALVRNKNDWNKTIDSLLL